MKRKSSRRDFLRGKSARNAMADAVEDALDGGEQSTAGKSAPPGGFLLQVSRRAMACEFQVSLSAGQYENGTQAALNALDVVEELETQMSVFRDDSELSHINNTAADEAVEVEPRLFELIRLSTRLHEETEGAFDITAGPLWKAWGFARREGSVPTEQQLEEALALVGGRMLELDEENETIRFKRPGMMLNLGSIGKGYALDRCGEYLVDEGIDDFLIHGGQSSVIARGGALPKQSETQTEGKAPWVVGIRHPLRPDRRIAEIHLRDKALATSGSRIQSFRHEGRRYGHIIDPRNGQPAEGVISATAIAPSAAEADALSTAFYVIGADAAIDYCRTHPQIGTVLVCPIRHRGGAEIRTEGLQEGELQVL